jgi:hypothetical protein
MRTSFMLLCGGSPRRFSERYNGGVFDRLLPFVEAVLLSSRQAMLFA